MAESLRGKLLISSARLGDPNFERTVVFLVAHDENGALGLVLNRSMDVPIARLASEVLHGDDTPREGMLYRGGPCESAVMVLFDDEAAPATIGEAGGPGAGMPGSGGTEVLPGLRFTGHGEIIEALLKSADGEVRFFVGYSGWGEGQLEREMEEQAWLALAARREHLFGPVDQLWEMAKAELVLGNRVNPAIMPRDPTVN